MARKRQHNFYDDEGFVDKGLRESTKRSSRQSARMMLDELTQYEGIEDIQEAWLDTTIEEGELDAS